MSVVIRLMRAGARKRPFFRMVAADSRRQRDGRFLEILGHYNTLTNPFELVVHKDLVEKWLSRGAEPSEQVASLLRRLGIPMHRAPAIKPEAPGLAGEAPAAPTAKAKRVVKRAVARKPPSARKLQRKQARKAAKASGPKSKPPAKKA